MLNLKRGNEFFFYAKHIQRIEVAKQKTIRHRQLFKAIESFLAPTPVLLLVIVIENRLKVKYELKKKPLSKQKWKRTTEYGENSSLKSLLFWQLNLTDQ